MGKEAEVAAKCIREPQNPQRSPMKMQLSEHSSPVNSLYYRTSEAPDLEASDLGFEAHLHLQMVRDLVVCLILGHIQI